MHFLAVISLFICFLILPFLFYSQYKNVFMISWGVGRSGMIFDFSFLFFPGRLKFQRLIPRVERKIRVKLNELWLSLNSWGK
jgi:hypothetical protein